MGASLLASLAALACGSDGAAGVPNGTGDAGTRADGGPDTRPCADGAITRLAYPYAPAINVVLTGSAPVLADERGLALFVGPSLDRTSPAADDAGYVAQILTGPSLERLSVLHTESMLRMSGLDTDYVYFGNQSIARIKRDGTAAPEELVKGFVNELLLDGDFIYYGTYSNIARIPKAGGAVEELVTPAPGSRFLQAILGVADGALLWFEWDVDQQVEATFRRSTPGSASPETIGRLPPQYIATYPAISAEGDIFFLAIDRTTEPVTGSLRVLRASASVPELIDENGSAPILLDGTNLYYRDLTQGIVRRPRSGGPSTIVATQEPTRILALLVVASDLYLFSGSGCVYRVPKD